MQHSLYFVHQIRQCEQMAIEELGISEDELMLNAGLKAFNLIKEKYPNKKSIAVFCGGGNNGGDGYTLAKLASDEGYQVIIYQTHALEELPTTARHAALMAIESGVQCLCLEETIDSEVELIVDALLGIGLESEVRDACGHLIRVINESALPVVSIDIPSGLQADTGKILGACVKADYTITYIGKKLGLYTLDGPDYSGNVILDSLGLESCLNTLKPCAQLFLDESDLSLPAPRIKNSNKSLYGHVLVIGGGIGMPGATVLAANAALRAGAGMVSIAFDPQYAVSVLPQLPEVMFYGIKSIDKLKHLLEKASVVVLGPGLGVDSWAEEIFNTVISCQLPLIVDASALRLLAKNPQYDDNWILTPHPGEAGALLNKETNDIQNNRLKACQNIQKIYGGSVILKGVGTIIHSGNDETFVCSRGNPGMATAGMGDLLTGIIAALVAQGMTISQAAKNGVLLHAIAGDRAARAEGMRGLMASDLMPYIRACVNNL